MKNIKYKLNIGRLIKSTILIILVTSCSDYLDVNTNPNNPDKASIDLLLPGAMVGAGFWTQRSQNENAAIFSRQFYNLNESTYNIQGNLTDTEFNQLYADPLKDFQQIIDEAEERQLRGYAGVAKLMKAYLFSVIVDLWGDVPYSEALQESILNPKFDDDRDIYNNLLLLADEAIADFNAAVEAEEVVTGDLVYDGDFDNWIRAANTFKLKLLLNMRLVDTEKARTGITELINGGMLIEDNSQDFQFQFGENVSPINQHPIYQQEYITGTKNFYMSNYLMYTMLTKEDPRLKYYIYRQGSFGELDFQTSPCNSRTDCVYWPQLLAFGEEADGYIGREHGDPSGLPADNTVRATFGVYPIGGSYDDDSREERKITSATGKGLAVWITNNMRSFMLAEAALTLGTPGDPAALLEEGIRASMDKVATFGASLDANAPSPTDPDLVASIDNYVAARLESYTTANGDAQRLNVIISEKYFSQFGQGVESYNDYRRTGFPNLPEALSPSGPFPVRFPLGPTELTSNPFAPQPAPLVSEPVFWDVN
jgi:hypothetical protein